MFSQLLFGVRGLQLLLSLFSSLCLFCFGLAMSPPHLFLPLDFSKDSFRNCLSFHEKKDSNFSFSLCLSPSFLCRPFSEGKGHPCNALSLCLSLLFQLSADFFFHLSPRSLALSCSLCLSLPLPSLRCQWASNWGSVIGREKRLGEK